MVLGRIIVVPVDDLKVQNVSFIPIKTAGGNKISSLVSDEIFYTSVNEWKKKENKVLYIYSIFQVEMEDIDNHEKEYFLKMLNWYKKHCLFEKKYFNCIKKYLEGME